jgi:hypothetical protein
VIDDRPRSDDLRAPRFVLAAIANHLINFANAIAHQQDDDRRSAVQTRYLRRVRRHQRTPMLPDGLGDLVTTFR